LIAFGILFLLFSPSVLTSYAYLVNNESATIVIGQPNYIAKACVNNPPTTGGLCTPYGTAFDLSGNLWVADYSNNRVLEFRAPFSNGEAASVVIGQSGFKTEACAVKQSGLCLPMGIAFDKSGNLWIADGGNNRVLEFRAPFSNGEAASVVIGQSEFTTRTCATKQKSLCIPEGITFDKSGNLWVADYGNSRVLEFAAPLSNGKAASVVIGQPGFTTRTCATTQVSLCYPVGIASDSSGNLWVVDGKNRILEFAAPLSNGKASTVVIGQSTFVTHTCATTQNGLCAPYGITLDSSGNLWVADGGNSRVLKFSAPFSNGELASVVIGQSSFTTNICAETQSNLCSPRGVTFDSSGNLWIADTSNNRVLSFSRLTTGELASTAVGAPNFTTRACATKQSGLCAPAGVTFDKSGDLWVADYSNNRVLEFRAPFSNGEAASVVIGQTGFTTRTCVLKQSGLCLPMGIAFDKSGNLWIADRGNNRVLEFRAPFSNGEAASVVIGQTGFTTRTCAVKQKSLCIPEGIAFDSSGSLWVADYGNNRVLEFRAPFSNGEAASVVIGQTGFTTRTCATKQSGLCAPAGVTFDKSGDLWVADYSNNRVLEFRAPSSNGEAASVVIGQTGFTTRACATKQSGLCSPKDIAFDRLSDLWVADGNNNRILEFVAPLFNGEAASVVIGQTGFTTGSCATTRSGLCVPASVTFDKSGDLWVADYSNNRVLEFT
jgi:sugar lactone lactonase YvrE